MSVVIARDIVTVAGPDAARYLQGQLSNDVNSLAEGASCWSFLLEPAGVLGHLVRVARRAEDRFELDTDDGAGDAVVARLRRFLIRTKAELSTGAGRVSLDGHGLIGWWGEGEHGWTDDALTPDSHATAARLDAGWPGPAELNEGRIPAETGVVPVAASFTKGCYTGQELVARIDSRGNNVPHRLRVVELGAPAHPGDAVLVGGVEQGRLTSVAGLRAFAYVHRSVEVPAAAEVGGAAATVGPQR